MTTEANSAYNKNGDIWFTYTEHKLGFFLLTLFFPEGQLGPCKLKGTLGLPQFCPWQLLNGCLKPVNYTVPKYIKGIGTFVCRFRPSSPLFREQRDGNAILFMLILRPAEFSHCWMDQE